MIGKLKGTIDEIGEDYVLVDVHGVGYVAYCGARTLSALGGAGEAVILFIEGLPLQAIGSLFEIQ